MLTTTLDLFSPVLPDLPHASVTPVLSRTRPGLLHMVIRSWDENTGQWVWYCTCEATRTCWHIREVRNQKEG